MTGDDLRRKADRVFSLQHPGRHNAARQQERERTIIDRQIGDDLPNGPASVLRASWRSHNGGPEDFSIRGWMSDPFGQWMPLTGFGVHVRPDMLPGLAALVAAGLDELEDSGGRFPRRGR